MSMICGERILNMKTKTEKDMSAEQAGFKAVDLMCKVREELSNCITRTRNVILKKSKKQWQTLKRDDKKSTANPLA